MVRRTLAAGTDGRVGDGFHRMLNAAVAGARALGPGRPVALKHAVTIAALRAAHLGFHRRLAHLPAEPR